MACFMKWLIFPCMGLLLLFCCTGDGVTEEKKVRAYLTTMAWYPDSAPELKELLDGFFKKTKAHGYTGKVVGLISPHAGLSHSGLCAASGFKQLAGRKDIERVILLGVSHRSGFYGAAVGDFTHESTPLGLIEVDTEITGKLAKERLFKKDNALMQKEHSLENVLPFLQYMMNEQKNTGYKIVSILFSHMTEKDVQKAAVIINKYVTDKTLLIASSDFTHYGSNYGYVPFVKDIKNNLTALDTGMIKTITQLDLKGYRNYMEKTGITMCGFVPVGVLLHILAGKGYTGTVMDYYKSADGTNDYSLSVSYAAIVFYDKNAKKKNRENKMTTDKRDKTENTETNPLKLTKTDEEVLLKLARQTLEDYFAGKKDSLGDIERQYGFSKGLQENAGVFVTLREEGDLRGCIGAIVGREPLWQGVRSNALNAALHDPRFNRVEKNELKKIAIEISVMTPLQEITDYKTIRVGIDGVIIRKGNYQAVFLPQVATETGWNLDEFLGHLCQKAGLPMNAYQAEGMEFLIFQALVFGEKEE